MNRYGSWSVSVSTTVSAGSKRVRIAPSAESNDTCCARMPGAVRFSTVEFIAPASGAWLTGAAYTNTTACMATSAAPQTSSRQSLGAARTTAALPNTHNAGTNTRSWPGSVESTSHRNTNGGAIHSTQKTPNAERDRLRSQRAAARLSHMVANTRLGPTTTSSVPKLISVLPVN